MNDDAEQGQPVKEIGKRLADWRAEAEQWVDDTCHRAVARLKSVLVEEIRALSRRVEKMHELLDQLEHMVDARGEASEPREEDLPAGRGGSTQRGDDLA